MTAAKQVKPATPHLPLKCEDDREGYRTIIVDALGNEIAHDLPYEHYFDSQYAAYIVHACNAYPKLVEALRAYVDRINDNHFAKPYVPEDDRRKARALLRELGEAE